MQSSFRKPLVIVRLGKTELTEDGLFTVPKQSRFTVNASVQPLKPTEMQALPEGRRGCRAVKVYTDVPLYMANQRTGQQADKFKWLGLWMEVVASDWYQSDVINHYRAYATEVLDH